MMIDPVHMQQYLGCDADFQRQYLGLLRDSVQSCLTELAAPTSKTYAVLHAAKAGISVVACAELREQLHSVCDQTMHWHDASQSTNLCLQLQLVKAQLSKLLQDIDARLHGTVSARAPE